MNPQHYRILHEYEIEDSLGQHHASLLYLRDFNNPNLDNNSMDEVDRLLERSINKCCKVNLHKSPRQIVFDNEVDELDKRLKDSFQLKAYFSFYSDDLIKGGGAYGGRITIHTTILVNDESDIPFFENVGLYEPMADWDLLNLTIAQHTPCPVYTIQEHPLVHGIVCFKDAAEQGVVYVLYRHNNNSLETVLARINTGNNKVDLLQGSDSTQNMEIERFAQSVNFANNLLPLYNCHYTQGIVPYYPVSLVLNRERVLFSKAKDLLMAELKKQQSANNNYSETILYLSKLFEA